MRQTQTKIWSGPNMHFGYLLGCSKNNPFRPQEHTRSLMYIIFLRTLVCSRPRVGLGHRGPHGRRQRCSCLCLVICTGGVVCLCLVICPWFFAYNIFILYLLLGYGLWVCSWSATYLTIKVFLDYYSWPSIRMPRGFVLVFVRLFVIV